MIFASPNLYRKTAKDRGIQPELVERALAQARAPEENGLPAILTLSHLAHITGSGYASLRTIVERQNDPYKPFKIAKRKGGVRVIAAPEPNLALVQRWIATKILSKLPVHHASGAYALGSSTKRCAVRHLGASWLIKVDIHDFFESISERAVYRVFRSAGYQPLVSLELARLCTRLPHGDESQNPKWQLKRREAGTIKPYKTWALGHLPQGAPTSPMLANLASYRLDVALQALADRYSLTFTRYSDDIAFSTGGHFSHKEAGQLLVEIERIFKTAGHALHRKKISISPPGARKIFLGVLVHGTKPRLSKEYRRKLADHVRGIEIFGLSSHAEHRHFDSLWGMVRHIQGLLSYAEYVEGLDMMQKIRESFEKVLNKEDWGDFDNK